MTRFRSIAFASFFRGSSIERSGPFPYHHGMPFCANITAVSGPSSGAAASANASSRFAFIVTMTKSCFPGFSVRTLP